MKSFRWMHRVGFVLALSWATPGLAAGYVECLPDSTPGYVHPKPNSSSSVTVFIHGLHGDGKDTWTYSGGFWSRINPFSSRVAWPCLLPQDDTVFARHNVFLASYRSEAGKPNPTLDDVVQQLAQTMATEGIFLHGHVAFVAHSMGGIVLAKLLTQPGLLGQVEREKVKLVTFYGTPALPSEAARICDALNLSSQCKELVDETALQKLWDAWDRLAARPPTYCVAEGEATGFGDVKLLIVPSASAFRPCMSGRSASVTAVGYDHSSLVKPSGMKDSPHQTLRNAFSACVKPDVVRTSLNRAAEELTTRASNWFYALKDRLRQLADPERIRVDLATYLPAGQSWFWISMRLQPTFALGPEYHHRVDAGTFMLELRNQRETYLTEPDVAWVRDIDGWADVTEDGSFHQMLDEMRRRGQLQRGDVMIGLDRQGADPGGRTILVVRDMSSLAGTGAGQLAQFALVGTFVIPSRANYCIPVASR